MKIFEVSQSFPVSAKVIYEAWLDSGEHTNMTGGEANCTDQVGGKFSAWDGYISGSNESLSPYSRIVQSWRTSEFEGNAEDSQIEIIIIDNDNGCQVTLNHSNIPDGQPDYQQGWKDNYFLPMLEYFKGS